LNDFAAAIALRFRDDSCFIRIRGARPSLAFGLRHTVSNFSAHARWVINCYPNQRIAPMFVQRLAPSRHRYLFAQAAQGSAEDSGRVPQLISASTIDRLTNNAAD